MLESFQFYHDISPQRTWSIYKAEETKHQLATYAFAHQTYRSIYDGGTTITP